MHSREEKETLVRALTFVAVSFLFIFFFQPSCTNLQIDQTTKRFKENMSGELAGFSDVSPSNPRQFSFSAMGDTHVGSHTASLMVKALQMSRDAGDSFAVIAGDNSNTGIDSELRTFKSYIDSVGLPVYPAIGNHDIFFGGWNNYRSIIGRSIYSVNAGDAHLIFLDTANGTFGEDQLNWLQQDLDANTRPIRVVVTHFPIYVNELSTVYKISSDEEAFVFKKIMDDHNVQLVISGHYHGFTDKKLGKTRYLVTGGCNNMIDLGNHAHFLRITVDNETISVNEVSLE